MAKLTNKNSKKDDKSRGNMKRKAYEAELRKPQVKLYHLQKWVRQKVLRVMIAFEGRDAAAVGGF